MPWGSGDGFQVREWRPAVGVTLPVYRSGRPEPAGLWRPAWPGRLVHLPVFSCHLMLVLSPWAFTTVSPESLFELGICVGLHPPPPPVS